MKLFVKCENSWLSNVMPNHAAANPAIALRLQFTPLVGWIATNLYRDKSEKGWCLEADPGQGEYIVFYRLNFK